VVIAYFERNLRGTFGWGGGVGTIDLDEDGAGSQKEALLDANVAV
jgi:hypothetical protein